MPDRRRLRIVYNPVSGRGRGERGARVVADRASAAGWDVVQCATKRPGHARELAREAVAARVDRLGVIGGDGTVRDVVAGLAGASIPLAILPAGTGNDLARTLGIARQLESAVRVLLEGRERDLDVWLWNGESFVNVAGVGLDAAVADAVNRRLRFLRGTLAYLAGVAITLPRFRPIRIRLTGDDWTHAGDAMLVAVANAQYYGGGMRIAPDARVDDGLLSVVVVGAASKLELVRQMPRVFAGTHLAHPLVKSFATRRLQVETDGEQPVTLDGELLGGLPATIERAPYSVRILVPRAG